MSLKDGVGRRNALFKPDAGVQENAARKMERKGGGGTAQDKISLDNKNHQDGF